MSLTQTHHVFAAVGEGGINTLLKSILTARPHYINYGSSTFVPATTAAATNMAPIPFPGIPGGIQWAVSFAIPVVDLFPDSSGGTAPLKPGPNQFSVHTKVKITLGCFTWTSTGGDNGKGGKMTPVVTELDVWAIGEILSQYWGPGTGQISFQVDRVLLPGIKPDTLEAVLECLIKMLLTAALETIRIPFGVLSAGAFQLILEQGPVIDDNQVEVWGDI